MAIFSATNAFTPGPNNLLLMTSGVNFGVARTVPHLLGVILGFPVMMIVVGLGLSGLFTAWPPALVILKIASVAYTLWLAWKVAHAAAPHVAGTAARPMTFLQAVAFQWVNGKAWTMALTAMALFAPDQSLRSILIVAGLFGLIGVGSSTTWMIAGRAVRGWLTAPERLRVFNWTMALLLVGSLALAL